MLRERPVFPTFCLISAERLGPTDGVHFSTASSGGAATTSTSVLGSSASSNTSNALGGSGAVNTVGPTGGSWVDTTVHTAVGGTDAVGTPVSLSGAGGMSSTMGGTPSAGGVPGTYATTSASSSSVTGGLPLLHAKLDCESGVSSFEFRHPLDQCFQSLTIKQIEQLEGRPTWVLLANLPLPHG